jgi:hypothetical protein
MNLWLPSFQNQVVLQTSGVGCRYDKGGSGRSAALAASLILLCQWHTAVSSVKMYEPCLLWTNLNHMELIDLRASLRTCQWKLHRAVVPRRSRFGKEQHAKSIIGHILILEQRYFSTRDIESLLLCLREEFTLIIGKFRVF